MKCVKRYFPKSAVAPASYRRRNVKGGFLIFACRKSRWKKGVCRGGIKLWEKARTTVKSCHQDERRRG